MEAHRSAAVISIKVKILHRKPQAATFDDILAEYYEPLYRHVRRMVVSHDDAKDVMQEAMLRIYQGLDKLKDVTALRTWVWRIATNEALRHLSRRHGTDTELTDEMIRTIEDEPYVDRSDQLATAIAKAMTALTPRQKQIFDLRHFDDMSFADISAIADITEETARATFHQARIKMRNILENMGIKP